LNMIKGHNTIRISMPLTLLDLACATENWV